MRTCVCVCLGLRACVRKVALSCLAVPRPSCWPGHPCTPHSRRTRPRSQHSPAPTSELRPSSPCFSSHVRRSHHGATANRVCVWDAAAGSSAREPLWDDRPGLMPKNLAAEAQACVEHMQLAERLVAVAGALVPDTNSNICAGTGHIRARTGRVRTCTSPRSQAAPLCRAGTSSARPVAVPAQSGRGEQSPGADVAGASKVPAQKWQGRHTQKDTRPV